MPKYFDKSIKILFDRLRGHMKTIYPSVFNKAEVRTELDRLHDQYVLVPADKASNNIVFVCKAHYKTLQNHKSVMDIFNIPKTQNELDLPYSYWIPKLHKSPYKQIYIAGSSKCSTKLLSLLLTKILTVVKEKLQVCCIEFFGHFQRKKKLLQLFTTIFVRKLFVL